MKFTNLKDKALGLGKEKLSSVLSSDKNDNTEPLAIKNDLQIMTWEKFYKNIYLLKHENKSYNKTDQDLIAGLGDKRYFTVYKFSRRRYSVELVPEPTNEHDKNAIMVLFDGLHVGYIPSELTKQYRSAVKDAGSLFYGEIKGGAYKLVRADYVEDKLDPFTLTLKLKK